MLSTAALRAVMKDAYLSGKIFCVPFERNKLRVGQSHHQRVNHGGQS